MSPSRPAPTETLQFCAQAWDSPEAAAMYERGRPGYAPEAIAFLASELQLGPESTIVDLGAGTGKLTRQLAATRARVIAVEPLPAMRSALQEQFPYVPVLEGAAEAIPLDSGSVDAVCAAQAWHWFDGDRAIPEVARVLKPGGALALLWNEYDQSLPWVSAFANLRYESQISTTAYSDPESLSRFAGRPEWSMVQHASFAHRDSTSRDALVYRMLSSSTISALPAWKRAQMERRINQLLATYPETRDIGTILVPYVTEVFWTNLLEVASAVDQTASPADSVGALAAKA